MFHMEATYQLHFLMKISLIQKKSNGMFESKDQNLFSLKLSEMGVVTNHGVYIYAHTHSPFKFGYKKGI